MDNFKQTVLAAAFTLMTMAGTASSQEKADTPPAAENMELAGKLLDANGTMSTFNGLLPGIADQTKAVLIRNNPQMQLGIIEIVDRVALDLVERRPVLDDALTQLWASNFTAAELQDMLDFYNSETGAKLAKLNPPLIKRSLEIAAVWERAVTKELAQQVGRELNLAVKEEVAPESGAQPAEQN